MEFAADAVALLEESVHKLLASGWHEPLRRRAHETAVALSHGADAADLKRQAALLRSVASLLALPLSDVLPIRHEVREKLLEMLDALRESPRSETA